MNIELLRSEFIGSAAVQDFALYYISPYDLEGFFPEVRKYIVGSCPVVSRLAYDFYDKLLYNELSKIDYLGFSCLVMKRHKVGVLALNGIIAINNDDDDELLSLLKDLGEEKVLKTLCTDEFWDDYLYFN